MNEEVTSSRIQAVLMPNLRLSGTHYNFPPFFITTLDPKDIHEIDSDHCYASMIERAKPVAFGAISDDVTSEASAAEYLFRKYAHLFNLTLITGIGGFFPDPFSSIYYDLRAGNRVEINEQNRVKISNIKPASLRRSVGITGRSALYHNRPPSELSKSNIEDLLKIYFFWATIGISPEHPIFLPVRAARPLGYGSPPQFAASIMSTVVALESVVLGEKKRGIAREVARRVSALIESDSEERISSCVISAYKFRSKMIHGELPLDYDDELAFWPKLHEVVRSFTIASIVKVFHLSPNSIDDIDFYRKVWSEECA